jgi:hypothetical protein
MEEFLKKDANYITKAYVLIRLASYMKDYTELLHELEDLTNQYDIGYLEILDASEELNVDVVEFAEKLVARDMSIFDII